MAESHAVRLFAARVWQDEPMVDFASGRECDMDKDKHVKSKLVRIAPQIKDW